MLRRCRCQPPCQTGACSGHLCIYRHHRHLLYDGIYRALYRTVYGRRRFERHSAGTAVCTVYVRRGGRRYHYCICGVVCLYILIGNYFYAEFNIKFISENKLFLTVFRILAVLMVFVGANANLEIA